MSPIFCSKGHESPDSSLFCQVCGEKLSLPVKSLLAPGEVLESRYRIVQQIGQGGFGRTYLCENINRFNEPCVLKEFAPQVQGSYALDKAKTLFEREANVLHKLTHPQIPRFRELFQLNSGGGGLFLVQDYVAGPTYRYLLAQRMVQNQHFSEEEIRKFLIDTLPVLEYIHSLGVIHRDIAPDNLILRSSDNLPVLIDFGGVKQLAVNAEIQAIGGTDLPTCLGKVGYAPHEQLQRGKTYPHSDLYALAATALVLFTGKEPTEMIEPQNLIWNWRQFATLDPNFGAVLDRMLHPNITARFQTATEALAALQAKSTVAKGGNSLLRTMVITKKPKQTSNTAPAVSRGELWPILRRSWLALAALAVVGTGAWGISKIIPSSNTVNTPSPAASPMGVESSPSSSITPAASTSSSTKPVESTATNQSSATSGAGSGGNKPPETDSGRNARTAEPRSPGTNRSTNSRRTPKTESETPRRAKPQTEVPKTPKTSNKPKEEDGSGEDSGGSRRSSPSRSRNDSDSGSSKPSRASSGDSDSGSSKPSRASSGDSDSGSSRPSRASSGDSDGGSSKPSRASSGDSGNSNRPNRSTNRSDDSDGGPSRSRGSGGASNGSKRPESTNSKPAEEPLF